MIPGNVEEFFNRVLLNKNIELSVEIINDNSQSNSEYFEMIELKEQECVFENTVSQV